MIALLPQLASAESAVLKPVEFSVTADVGFGNEVCVIGSHLALGGGDPLKAPKLAWSPGNIWRGTIALEAGATFTHRFISRNYASGSWTSPANATQIGREISVTTPAHSVPPWGSKRVIYRSAFAQPRILFRDITHGGPWAERIMSVIGPGRTTGEQTFSADGLAPSGSDIEFVFNNGSGIFDNYLPPHALLAGLDLQAGTATIRYTGLFGTRQSLLASGFDAISDDK